MSIQELSVHSMMYGRLTCKGTEISREQDKEQTSFSRSIELFGPVQSNVFYNGGQSDILYFELSIVDGTLDGRAFSEIDEYHDGQLVALLLKKPLEEKYYGEYSKLCVGTAQARLFVKPEQFVFFSSRLSISHSVSFRTSFRRIDKKDDQRIVIYADSWNLHLHGKDLNAEEENEQS